MNYIIDIIDTQNNELVTKDERIISSSAVVDWQGGDRKDELDIVGSSLSFTMAGMSREDGQYYDLFTGDETRYKVRLYQPDETTIWTGFLLPDEYSEPYSNAPILVDFKATDGLGRLRGKFLPDDFYKEEKSVISIISECLRLTGLEFDLRFSPAIENSQNKDYNTIYLPTAIYKDNDKRQDAFNILQGLLQSMLCVCFQADNNWNIEGINVREQRVYTCKVYDYLGTYIEDREITRLYKELTGIATPEITMQPPTGFLTVSREKELFGLPEGLSSEENDGWAYRTQTISTYNSTRTEDKESFIYVSDWYGGVVNSNGFFAYSGVDGKVFFTYPSLSYPAPDQRIDLRYKPYVVAGTKYKLTFEFEINPISDDAEVNKKYVEQGDWQNPFQFDIAYFSYPEEEYIRVIGNSIAPSNPKYYPLNFGVDEKETITVDFQFIPKYSGDFIFTIRPLKQNIGIDKVFINELSLSIIGEQEEIVISENLIEGWTTKKEVELEYGSDVNGLGKTFRLNKLDEPYDSIEIRNSIIREFDYKEKHYVSVRLDVANLVDENKDKVSRPTVLDPNVLVPVEVIDVIYNYHNSDEHVIITVDPIFTEEIVVEVSRFGLVAENRDYWNEWTDSFYRIERNTYEQTVFNVYSRILNKELPSIQNITAKNSIKFNDFTGFNFKNSKDWVITNCKWDIDQNYSDLSITQRYYVSEGNYSPIVEAGGEYFINQELGELTSEAFDPDGFIVSYFWEEVTATGATINSPNSQNTYFVLPSNVFYARFRVTVTDNDGNISFDEIDIYRNVEITVSLTEIFSEVSGNFKDYKHYRLDLSPELPEDMSLTFSGILELEYDGSYFTETINTLGSISQNGAITTQLLNNYNFDTDAPEVIQVGENNNLSVKSIYFNFDYISGDEVIFVLQTEFDDNNQNSLPIEAIAELDITEVSFNEGFGAISGLPLNERVRISQII